MSIPTEPVKRVCYADDLTVWATGVNISDMEDSLNSYLEEITAYLKDNSLLQEGKTPESDHIRGRSDIQLQGINRVLREHAPPNSDEEQRLNRRQRCTLPQLLMTSIAGLQA